MDYNKFICIVKDCNNPSLCSEKQNMNYSKDFCNKHSKSIESKCSICGTIINIKPRRYKESNYISCKSCSAKKNLERTRTKEASKKRMESMKKNGTYQNWRNSCESTEARKLGYKNMVENGKVNNLIKASNNSEVLKRKQESRIKSGSFKKFMDAGHKETKRLWHEDEEYRKRQLEENLIRFDREKFYSSKINGIELDGKDINLSDIDNYKGVSGVWAKFSSNGECLDISETNNIKEEILFSIRAIEEGKKNLNKTDEDIYKLYNNRLYLYRKYRDIAKYNIVFKIVATDITSKTERMEIEAKYAHKNRAIFWSPAPDQHEIINNILEEANNV